MSRVLTFLHYSIFNLFNALLVSLRECSYLFDTTSFVFFITSWCNVFSSLDLELFFEVGQFFTHTWVPVILDGVVCTSVQNLSNISPRVPVLSVANVKNPLLFFAPGVFLYHRIQMVVPALTTLLSGTIIKMRGNLGPFLSAFFLYKQ